MKHFEAEASFTVQRSLAAAVFLYLCMISYVDKSDLVSRTPHAAGSTANLFPSP